MGAVAGIFLLALCGPGSAKDHAPAELNGQLDGTWRLERRENLEEYEKATGASWLRRRLSNLASGMTQEIHQTGDRFQITLRAHLVAKVSSTTWIFDPIEVPGPSAKP
jgi:hypothetical protein